MNYVNLPSFINKFANRLETATQRTRLFSKPTDITIEPTLQCNSDCIMCNRNFHRTETKKATGLLSWETLSAIKPFIQTAERVLFGGFGEPLLHPEYLPMLKDIKKTSNPFIYFFTNGILLTEKTGRDLVDAGIDMICISMGGATRKTYARIRGVDAFDTVVANIRAVHEYKKAHNTTKPRLSFNIVAMNSLMAEISQIITLASKIGVNHIAMPNLTAQGESIKSESLWHDVEKAKEILVKNDALAKKMGIEFVPPDLSVHQGDCKALFKQMVINWDGTVMSCSQERFITGNLRNNSIDEIWNSEGMVKLRKTYYEKGLCKLCDKCSCWDNRPEIFLDPWENARQFAKRIF